jgi:hypothetical protein
MYNAILHNEIVIKSSEAEFMNIQFLIDYSILIRTKLSTKIFHFLYTIYKLFWQFHIFMSYTQHILNHHLLSWIYQWKYNARLDKLINKVIVIYEFIY